MIEQTLDVRTAAGEMETFVCRPKRGGPFPAVFLLMDAPGIREELRDMARRLGTVGYFVLLPNLSTAPDATRCFGRTCSRKAARSATACGMSAPDDHSAGHGRRCRDARLYRPAR